MLGGEEFSFGLGGGKDLWIVGVGRGSRVRFESCRELGLNFVLVCVWFRFSDKFFLFRFWFCFL